ncbi:class D sortase [Romboutsia sp. 13368]|uniref:class D sortase n=1 Tax=Romboutsia sp. 13368 TaxID=2708053 RepID=UPI0025D9EEAD|nr:class D sortase [Romboutsia sp. 13368]
MKSKISKILIIMGLLICVGSLSIKGYSKYLENKSTKSFEEKIDKNPNEPKEDDFSNVKAGDEIAIINIPAIKLNTVVIESIEKEYLNHYVCHFENTAMPGQYGNFSLAGHSSYRYNEVFNELHKISLGDEIIIKTLNNEFTYIVNDILEVNPEDTYVLDQDNEIKELTIVTCTNKGKDRLIVKAKIDDDKNNNK